VRRVFGWSPVTGRSACCVRRRSQGWRSSAGISYMRVRGYAADESLFVPGTGTVAFPNFDRTLDRLWRSMPRDGSVWSPTSAASALCNQDDRRAPIPSACVSTITYSVLVLRPDTAVALFAHRFVRRGALSVLIGAPECSHDQHRGDQVRDGCRHRRRSHGVQATHA